MPRTKLHSGKFLRIHVGTFFCFSRFSSPEFVKFAKYSVRKAKSFKVGIYVSGHDERCLCGLITKAWVLGNLHGISPNVHNGGRANFKSAARSDRILSIPQKQKTLKPLEIGSPRLLPNPTKDSLAKDKNTTRFVPSCRLDRLFVIETVSFLSSSVVNLYLQWQDLSIF